MSEAGGSGVGASSGMGVQAASGAEYACGVREMKYGDGSRRGARTRPASVASIRSMPEDRSQTSSPSASKNSTRCQGMSPPGVKRGSGTRLGTVPRCATPITKRAGSNRVSQRTRW